MAQVLLAILISFVLFVSILVFFIKHKQRMPYYQIDQAGCVQLLRQAVDGELLERDWHVFIGISVRYDAEIEQLRLQCIVIDENHVINSVTKKGQNYVVFSKQGLSELQALLEEWQHKVDYLA
ncbi:hypothetical protein MAQ5080_02762 [Marinomonas aquimarina]|uniref:Uncharacterized protein n=1 Tax=Marinomonas aquimarina TaxID=295068 RepID=A0A1A8TLV2_9GAMM|nr:hypothetical protein [Marinomonas aquimarina]SBS34055.1 hypothetical protein MAQ5080_02762 [Marinomonas aquimarina]